MGHARRAQHRARPAAAAAVAVVGAAVLLGPLAGVASADAPPAEGARRAPGAERSVPRLDPVFYPYVVRTRGNVRSDVEEFARRAAGTLEDTRGWDLNGSVEFARVAGDGPEPSFTLWLATPEEVEQFASICSSQWSCQVGDHVIINDDRWRFGTEHRPGTLHDYRHYVVNHEVGHWLFLRHRDCPAPGAPAPVMMQQSKGLDGCEKRTWPLESELLDVFERNVPAARWFSEHGLDGDADADGTAVYGSAGDLLVTGDWDGDGTDGVGVVADTLWDLSDSPPGGAPEVDHVLGFGLPEDTPVVGDWDGDGTDDIGVVRHNTWYLDHGDGGIAETEMHFGAPGDLPVAGDWDGDGTDEIGVVRHNTWYLDHGDGGIAEVEEHFGAPSDARTHGADWNGDGADGIAVVRWEP